MLDLVIQIMDPWLSKAEYEEVSSMVCAVMDRLEDKAYIGKVISALSVWMTRVPAPPMGVEATVELLTTLWSVSSLQPERSTRAVSDQLVLSTGIIRFINRVSHTAQKGDTSSHAGGKVSIHQAAVRGLGVSGWLVNARHDATHGPSLPPLHLLQTGAVVAMRWLLDNYWCLPEEVFSGPEDERCWSAGGPSCVSSAGAGDGATCDDSLLGRTTDLVDRLCSGHVTLEVDRLAASLKQLRYLARKLFRSAQCEAALRWLTDFITQSPPQRLDVGDVCSNTVIILISAVVRCGQLQLLLKLLLKAARISHTASEWLQDIVSACVTHSQADESVLSSVQQVLLTDCLVLTDLRVDWHSLITDLLIQRSPVACSLLPRLLHLESSISSERRDLLLQLFNVSLGREMSLQSQRLTSVDERMLISAGVPLLSCRTCSTKLPTNDVTQAMEDDVICMTETDVICLDGTDLPAWSLCQDGLFLSLVTFSL